MTSSIRAILCFSLLALPVGGCSYFRPRKSALPVARTAPAKQTAGVAHVVDRGDTLFKIAKHYSGDGDNWKKIASANPKVNPNRLRPGQEVVIPFTLFASAPVAYSDMRLARARLSTATQTDAAVAPSPKKKKTAAATKPTRSKKSSAARKTTKSKPKLNDGEIHLEEPIGDDPAPTEVVFVPPAAPPVVPPVSKPAPPVEIAKAEITADQIAKVEPVKPIKVDPPPKPAMRRIEPKRLVSTQPAAPTLGTRPSKKPPREPAAPRLDDEAQQVSRSQFYSCMADKCSLRSF